jgi:uncharacterized metal-binding protein/predicted Fe-Mo cluster-binding NifX family protein
MRVGIPLLGERVAPRCTIADSVLLITVKRRRILAESMLALPSATWLELARLLADQEVDALVCGGIGRSTRESIQSQDVQVIDNVAGTAREVVEALRRGALRPGFGLAAGDGSAAPANGGEVEDRDTGTRAERVLVARKKVGRISGAVDCLACADRVCLRAERCPHLSAPTPAPAQDCEKALEAAWDVACEDERTLCRLAELVYFALEMGYTKLGVAFCVDLLEPTTILTGVLRRFFEVVPVCCKVGAAAPAGTAPTAGPKDRGAEGRDAVACDPVTQAAVLNDAGTDLNVLVGLCVGVDGILARESRAPVTTVFVKDKSLANNPIGAVYSHYHLEDI